MSKHERWELAQMQSLPLDAKIRMTEYRIREWVEYYGEDCVSVSFSGGKDSTVLLDIVRQDYPDVHAVFIDDADILFNNAGLQNCEDNS